MSETISTAIRDFITETFLFGDSASVPADDASLIDNGIIDSTAVLELVSFIEEQFKFTIGDADIVPANLDSIASISAFVQSKIKAETA